MTSPVFGVQVTYYSQAQLALAYSLRTGASFTLPRMLMDAEANRQEHDAMLAPFRELEAPAASDESGGGLGVASINPGPSETETH